MAGREALRAGMIMRVGDGRSISIWDDKWIPGTIRMSPMLRPTNTSLQSVHELIDDGTWTWKHS